MKFFNSIGRRYLNTEYAIFDQFKMLWLHAMQVWMQDDEDDPTGDTTKQKDTRVR